MTSTNHRGITDLTYGRLSLANRTAIEFVARPGTPLRRAVDRLDPTSSGRRLLRPFIKVAAGIVPLRTAKLEVARQRQCVEAFETVAEAAQRFGYDIAGAALPPLGPWRPDRVCFICVDRSGEPVLFAKVRSSASHHDEQIQEIAALLSTEGLGGFRRPQVIGELQTSDISAMLTTLPPGRRTRPDWSAVVDRLAQRAHRSEAKVVLGRESWWPEVATAPLDDWLLSEIDQLSTATVDVGPVHADVRPSNVADAAGELWLLDWESYDRSAPWASDLVMAGTVTNPPLLAATTVPPPSQLFIPRIDVLASAAYLTTHNQAAAARRAAALIKDQSIAGLTIG